MIEILTPGDLISYCGLQPSDDDESVIVKVPRRRIDWPVLLERLVNQGISVEKISSVTGIGKSTIVQLKNESTGTENLDKVILLLGLYLLNTKLDVPILGDDN